MRFEAKHSYFKTLANVIGNFTNVAKSLSQRHQHWMCYKLQTLTGSGRSFVEKGIKVGPGNASICFNLAHRICARGVVWIGFKGLRPLVKMSHVDWGR
jgi:hypothetical protein